MEATVDVGRTQRVTNYMKRNPRTRNLLILAALVLLVGIFLLWRYYSVRESTDDAQIDGHIVPISAKVGGMVIEVAVRENQYVKAGDLLARIDPRDYEVAVAKAQADLDQAQAQATGASNQASVQSTGTQSALQTARSELASTQQGVAAARARLDAANARVREAKANYERASKDLERLRPLAAKDEISQRELDASVSNADAARATVDSANAAAQEAQQNVATAQAKVNQAQATLRTAGMVPERNAVSQAESSSAQAKVQLMKATLEQAKLDLQYTILKAPESGWVSRKTMEVGQVIQPGQPLLALVPLADVWVTANFKETQLKQMQPGQHATVSVDAYGGREYEAQVESISAATGARFSLLPPENATGNYVKVVQRVPVRIAFQKGQDSQHLLRPGMSVTVTVLTK